MKKTNMLKDVCISDFMNKMNKLNIGKIYKNWRLSELTKKQNELFRKLKSNVLTHREILEFMVVINKMQNS